MNTSNTFLRYFKDKETDKYVSISDLEYSGAPIDEQGDEFDRDEYLYRFNHEKQEYEIIP